MAAEVQARAQQAGRLSALRGLRSSPSSPPSAPLLKPAVLAGVLPVTSASSVQRMVGAPSGGSARCSCKPTAAAAQARASAGSSDGNLSASRRHWQSVGARCLSSEQRGTLAICVYPFAKAAR